MRTAGPATRSAHTTFEFRECFFDANSSCLLLFAGSNPTNPLITCERGNIIPGCLSGRDTTDSFAQVWW